MTRQSDKSYHRNSEVNEIYSLFSNSRDLAMPGPRRLGKTFLLDQLVEAAPDYGWKAVKVEVAGCTESKAVFRELCQAIIREIPTMTKSKLIASQRLRQLFDPRFDQSGAWYKPFLEFNFEEFFFSLLKALAADKTQQWAILIDELPIFLKALHDKGPEGIAEARNFMNLTSRLRVSCPRVRWLITGSIGMEPLARAGNYMGVLAKYTTFELKPLTHLQAIDFVQDLAREGQLPSRQLITDAEAHAIVTTVGWCAAFYLDALAQKVRGLPSGDPTEAADIVERAALCLLSPAEIPTFGTWDEHLRKHYQAPESTIAFAVLNTISPHPQGLTIDNLLAAIGRPELTQPALMQLLLRLQADGFITCLADDITNGPFAFLNPLLRRWWQRFTPSSFS